MTGSSSKNSKITDILQLRNGTNYALTLIGPIAEAMSLIDFIAPNLFLSSSQNISVKMLVKSDFLRIFPNVFDNIILIEAVS